MTDFVPERDIHAQFISYSINYEDVVLRRIFRDRTDGFFVDVGAEHPCLGNDFYNLYTLGWSGINIEPNENYFRLLEDLRPRDRNLQLALSDVSEQDFIFFEVEGTGLSTCDEQQAEACAARGHAVKRHKVRTSTLKEVLDDARPPHIDILKVDVEGFEERVLLGNDWETYRPSIIMVEATYPLSPVRRPTNIRRNLDGVGYRQIHFDGLNDFFAEESFPVPSDATLPPNVFDDFVRYETASLRDENASLRREFAMAENYAHTLERERAEVHAIRQLAIASMLGEIDQVHGILSAGIVLPDQEPGQRQRPVLEQNKKFMTVSDRNVMDVSEPQTAAELISADVRVELLCARLQALITDNDRLASDIKDLRHENRRLLASNSQLHGENMSLRRALGPAYAMNDELVLSRNLLASTRDELALIRGMVAESLASQHSEPVKLLNAIQTSTSWRVTKPLRAIGRLLRSRQR